MKGLIFRIFLLTSVLLIGLLAMACPDGEKMADSIFKKMGLNRLRVITTKVEPEGVILTKGGKVYYIGKIAQFAGNTPPQFTKSEDKAVISATNSNANFGAQIVLNKSKSNSNAASNQTLATNVNATMDSPTTTDFLNSFLPVKADGKLSFTGSVNFDQIEAKDYGIPISEIIEYIYAQNSGTFRNQMKEFAKNGFKVYIVYEAFKSGKLHLVTTSGKEMGLNANFNQIYEIGGGISYKRDSNTSLTIDGQTEYTFAVRTLLMKYKNNSFTIEPGSYAGTGLGGADDRYSASPLTDSKEFPVINEISFEVPTIKK